MGDEETQSARGEEAHEAKRLPSLGEVLGKLAFRFHTEGALGVLFVDASSLADLERNFGADAHQNSLSNLGAVVHEILDDRLGISDTVILGETGRSEVAVFLFRGATEAGFSSRELPLLARLLREGIPKRGGRVAYPYLKSTPPLQVGTGIALANPTLGAETQIRSALQDAREHAGINAALDVRRRRSRLIELVLEGNIHSVYEPIVDTRSHTVFGYEALGPPRRARAESGTWRVSLRGSGT